MYECLYLLNMKRHYDVIYAKEKHKAINYSWIYEETAYCITVKTSSAERKSKRPSDLFLKSLQ